MKKMIICFWAVLFCAQMFCQKNDMFKAKYEFAQKTKGWIEGFSKSIGKNDFTYHSLRNDVTECMLTRCTDGSMSIEWLTAPVPEDISQGCSFAWLAAMDYHGSEKNFDLYINDVKRFTIRSGKVDNWAMKSVDGSGLSFIEFEKDQHGDGHGYMSLQAPSQWLTPNQPLKIKIIGEATNSNTWIIIYKAADALSYLQNSIKYESWMEAKLTKVNDKYICELSAPDNPANSILKYKIGDLPGSINLKKQDDLLTGEFEIPIEKFKKSFLSVADNVDEIMFVEPSFNSKIKIINNALIDNKVTRDEQGNIIIESNRIYKPGLVSNLLKLSEHPNASIYLFNSSHQDIAWMDTPEKCVIERDTMLLTPLLNQATKNPAYRFDIEDVLMVREYIERHPDRKVEINEGLHKGLFSCGSSYNMPYEEMYSGEALARQFYLGAKWLKNEFDGYKANIFWNPDVPGKTLQMAQIMKKAGTDFMVISRHEEGLFNWYSPDGSFVTTFSPGHYSKSFPYLQKDFFNSAEHIASNSIKYYKQKRPLLFAPILSDWDMSPAKDYSNLANNWNKLELNSENTRNKIPQIKITTAPEFFNSAKTMIKDLPSIKGERPAVWLYIHGPSHHEAVSANRDGDILLTAAEKFATIDALTSDNFIQYPQERLTKAWEAKIYPDHGWGGKGGEVTDALFKSKYEFAKNEAQSILNQSLNSLASKINIEKKKGIPVVVFNSLSWKRNDPVSFKINFDKGQSKGIMLKDFAGKEITFQLTDVKRYDDNSLQSATVNFIAENVPSIGYKTFYVSYSLKEEDQTKTKFNGNHENDFYNIEFGNGGIKQIKDKELNVNLIDASKFQAGEIFTMKSVGEDAGEFADIQMPTMEGYDKTGNYKGSWEIIENGSDFSQFRYTQQIRNAKVEHRIKVYNKIKRIDFETALLNWEGVMFREYRFALPLKMDSAQVSYEVPFGVVEVGKDEIEGAAGERYTTLCKDVHPRGIENWISASDNNIGVTLSSSVSVADYIDPTDNPITNVILQPLLLASRRSCHGEGNEYPQTGNHYYFFSLSSHKPGWENGYQHGKQANERLHVVINPNQYKDANLAEEKSFFSVNSKNIIITTIKKCEDDNNIILRCYDIEGKDTDATISGFKSVKKGELTNLIEESVKDIPAENTNLHLQINHHSIETIKITY